MENRVANGKPRIDRYADWFDYATGSTVNVGLNLPRDGFDAEIKRNARCEWKAAYQRYADRFDYATGSHVNVGLNLPRDGVVVVRGAS